MSLYVEWRSPEGITLVDQASRERFEDILLQAHMWIDCRQGAVAGEL